MRDTNGIAITNNVIYNTYRTGIVVMGRSNRVNNNLVATIYWSGMAQPIFVAQFSMNYDAAIMSSRDSFQLTMRVRTGQLMFASLNDYLKDNLVAGVQRLAYRIQGNGCSDNTSVATVNNEYANNEAHSAMCGVAIFPTDRVSPYDRGLFNHCLSRI